MSWHARRGGVIVFDGQSWVVTPTPETGYWSHLMPDLEPRFLTNVVAVSGTGYPYRTTNVAPLYDNIYQGKANGPRVMCDLAGQEEITNLVSAASILTLVENYHTARKAAGINYTVAHTHPPAATYTANPAMEAIRLAYNPLILASSVPDAVADFAQVAEDDPTGFGDPDNGDYWFLDHPWNDGPAVFAAEYKRVLEPLGII